MNSKNNNMKILITGATGIIGKKLIDFIVPFGHSISVLIKEEDRAKFQDQRVVCVVGDLLNKNSLDKATVDMDVVVHMAGITHTNITKLYFSINTEGTKNLLESCKKNNTKRFIYLSSRTASSDGGGYAYSKLLAEQAVKNFFNEWVVLRPAEVYGAGDKEAIARLVRIIRKARFIPIVGDGSYTLCPVYIDDVIHAIIKVIEEPKANKKTYVIGGPNEYSLEEIIDIISKQLNIFKIRVHIPIFMIKVLAYALSICKKDFVVRDQVPRLLCKKSGDIDPARKDFGYSPIPFMKGIKKIL